MIKNVYHNFPAVYIANTDLYSRSLLGPGRLHISGCVFIFVQLVKNHLARQCHPIRGKRVRLKHAGMENYRSSRWLRVLVLAQQLLGLTVCTWPRGKVRPRPTFSLPLCLWALFVQTWTFGVMVAFLWYELELFLRYQRAVYHVACTLTSLVCMMASFVAPLPLLSRSKELLGIIFELDAVSTSKVIPRQRTFGQLCLFLVYIANVIIPCYTFQRQPMAVPLIVMFSYFMVYALSSVSISLRLFDTVFLYLGNEIQQAAQNTSDLLCLRLSRADEPVDVCPEGTWILTCAATSSDPRKGLQLLLELERHIMLVRVQFINHAL